MIIIPVLFAAVTDCHPPTLVLLARYKCGYRVTSLYCFQFYLYEAILLPLSLAFSSSPPRICVPKIYGPLAIGGTSEVAHSSKHIKVVPMMFNSSSFAHQSICVSANSHWRLERIFIVSRFPFHFSPTANVLIFFSFRVCGN